MENPSIGHNSSHIASKNIDLGFGITFEGDEHLGYHTLRMAFRNAIENYDAKKITGLSLYIEKDDEPVYQERIMNVFLRPKKYQLSGNVRIGFSGTFSSSHNSLFSRSIKTDQGPETFVRAKQPEFELQFAKLEEATRKLYDSVRQIWDSVRFGTDFEAASKDYIEQIENIPTTIPLDQQYVPSRLSRFIDPEY